MGLLIKDDFKGPRVDFFFFLVGLKTSMFIGFTELNRYKTDGGTDAFINTSSMSRDVSWKPSRSRAADQTESFFRTNQLVCYRMSGSSKRLIHKCLKKKPMPIRNDLARGEPRFLLGLQGIRLRG